MTQEKVLILIGIVNLIIAILYFLILVFKKDFTRAFIMLIFMLICPVIAPMFLLSSDIQRLLFRNKDIDIENLSFRTDRLDMITEPDYEKEINIVPIEEALIISNNQEKRRVILDVLKTDYEASLEVINLGLANEDSETAHYVASVITDVKSNFKLNVQQMKEKIEKEPELTETIPLVLNYIHSFLIKKVLSEIEEITYIEQYELMLKQLFENNINLVTGEMFKNVIEHLLSAGRKDSASQWGERAMQYRPEDLDTYKGLLRLYYETDDRVNFLELLKTLKKSNIEYDKECIELFDYYKI